MIADSPCLPCQDDEHDTCHNLLWDAGCPCPHTSWPEPLCGVQGRSKGAERRWVCDLPALPLHRTHEGRYWFLPEPDDYHPWWGWRDRPEQWAPKRVVAPAGRFDPYDPTVPSDGDRVVA